jgi:multiple sugar transport system permease protein
MEGDLVRGGFYLAIPAVVVVVAVLLVPTLVTLGLSMASYSIVNPENSAFVGLANYTRLINDKEFWQSLVNTLWFVVITVPLELVIGFALALICNQAIRGRGVMRVAILLPWALPTALNALTWRWMYNTDFGLFNSIMLQLGLISKPINWLGQIPLAMVAMMTVAIWKTSSFMALIILTGLQAIPADYYEAARMDGAGFWQSLWRITIPLVKPSMFVALLFRSMDAFRAFDLPFNLTGGGPVNSTQLVTVYAHKLFFQFLQFDYASAIAVVQFVILFALSLVYIKNMKVEL